MCMVIKHGKLPAGVQLFRSTNNQKNNRLKYKINPMRLKKIQFKMEKIRIKFK